VCFYVYLRGVYFVCVCRGKRVLKDKVFRNSLKSKVYLKKHALRLCKG
jgi:hypothetical protein